MGLSINEDNIKTYNKYCKLVDDAGEMIGIYTEELTRDINDQFNNIELNTINQIILIKNKYSNISSVLVALEICDGLYVAIFGISVFICTNAGDPININYLLIMIGAVAIMTGICFIVAHFKNKYKKMLKGIK